MVPSIVDWGTGDWGLSEDCGLSDWRFIVE
jgi:hypothetical protein